MEADFLLLPIGHSLDKGRYTLIAPPADSNYQDSHLGMGGFGITYLAQDSLGEKVAIKELMVNNAMTRDENHQIQFLNFSKEEFSTAKKRLLTEGKRIRNLHHPNIVRATHFFEENNTAYLVMDYIQGFNVKDWVREHGTVPIKQCKEWLQQIGEALAYLHQQEIYHLDIKPSNIIISKTNKKAILIDFGISKQVLKNKLTSSHHYYSKGYAPPEQQKKEITPKPSIDLYALGATAFYMLTGEKPAPKNLQEQIDELHHIPVSLQSLLKKSIDPNPKKRYQTAKLFLQALAANDIEVAQPKSKFVLSCRYESRLLSLLLRLTRFGEVQYIHPDDGVTSNWVDNTFTGNSEGESRDQIFSSKIIADIEGQYKLNNHLRFTLGIHNFTNQFPDLHRHSANVSSGRFLFSRRVQQFGVGGLQLYTKIRILL